MTHSKPLEPFQATQPMFHWKVGSSEGTYQGQMLALELNLPTLLDALGIIKTGTVLSVSILWNFSKQNSGKESAFAREKFL